MRAALDEHGLTLSALAYYDNNLHPDPAEREANHAHVRACIDAAAALGGVPVGTFVGRDPGRSVAREPARRRARASARSSPTRQERGVKLMIENCVMEGWHPDGYPGNLAYSPELWEWMFELGLYLNFDPSHLLWLGIDPIAALKPYVDRVVHAHAKDAETFPWRARPLRLLRPRRHARARTPGTWAGGATASPASAQVDFRRYVDTLYEGGFDGVLSRRARGPGLGRHAGEGRAGPRDRPAQPATAGGRLMTAPTLEVRGLVKEYPGVKALKGVDFDVRAGRGPLPARPQRRRQVDADQVRLGRGRADRRRDPARRRAAAGRRPGRLARAAASRRSTRSSTSSRT